MAEVSAVLFAFRTDNNGGLMLKPLKEAEIIKQYSKPEQPLGKDNITHFPHSPLDVPVDTFKKSLERREQNQKELHRWVKEHLTPDIDYGSIHLDDNCQHARAGTPHFCTEERHWSIPVLLKPGAEKIINVLGLTVFFPNIHHYEMACSHHNIQELTQIVLKCELRTSTGKIVAEGVGARNIKQDDYNLNKALKMAVKSSVVDAVLRVGNLSAVFTTKWHNYSLLGQAVCNRDNLPHGINHSCNQIHRNTSPKPISKKQLQLILNIAGKKGLTTDGLNKTCKSIFDKEFKTLNREEASQLINHFNKQG